MNMSRGKMVTILAMLAAMAIAVAVYWPGLGGGFVFDDFPNIVDNAGLHPASASVGDLVRAALSSPSSEFKRPLSSLSFALNYLATGLDPFWMKLTNLLLHLANGVFGFILASQVLRSTRNAAEPVTPDAARRITFTALLIAFGWTVLPINLTAVLYVVQRMESLANLFVLAGLIGYFAVRMRAGRSGTTLAIGVVLLSTALGLADR